MFFILEKQLGWPMKQKEARVIGRIHVQGELPTFIKNNIYV